MSNIYLTVHAIAGTHIETAIEESIKVARLSNLTVLLIFNTKQVYVEIDSTRKEIYDKLMK